MPLKERSRLVENFCLPFERRSHQQRLIYFPGILMPSGMGLFLKESICIPMGCKFFPLRIAPLDKDCWHILVKHSGGRVVSAPKFGSQSPSLESHWSGIQLLIVRHLIAQSPPLSYIWHFNMTWRMLKRFKPLNHHHFLVIEAYIHSLQKIMNHSHQLISRMAQIYFIALDKSAQIKSFFLYFSMILKTSFHEEVLCGRKTSFLELYLNLNAAF